MRAWLAFNLVAVVCGLTCSGFQCPMDSTLVPSAENVVCGGGTGGRRLLDSRPCYYADCCITSTCGAGYAAHSLTCPTNKTLTPSVSCYANQPYGNTTVVCNATYCCSQNVAMCDSAVCDINHQLISNAGSVSCTGGNCTDAQCCVAPTNCIYPVQWQCPNNLLRTTNYSACNSKPCTDAACCTSYCTNFPALPTHVVANVQSNDPGSVAYFQCDPGFAYSGMSNMTCGATPTQVASWPAYLGGTCTAAVCLNPPVTKPGQTVTCSGNSYLDKCNVTCAPGYRLIGYSPLYCSAYNANTNWASANCVPNSCINPPGNPTDGTVTFSDGSHHGSVAHFTCGGAGTPPPDVVCNATTNATAWPSAQAGSCQSVNGVCSAWTCAPGSMNLGGACSGACTQAQCCAATMCTGTVSIGAGGSVSYSNGNNYNSIATVSCLSNYHLFLGATGTTTVTCNAVSSNVAWGTDTATCVLNQCTNPPTLSGGSVVFSNLNNPGSTANFSCSGNLRLVGNSYVTCVCPNNDLAWPTGPVCVAPICINPPNPPQYGRVSYSSNNDAGSTATFTCINGGTPPNPIVCGATTSDIPWPSAGASACLPPHCLNRPAPAYVQVAVSAGDSDGSVATFTCIGAGVPPPPVTCVANAGINANWPSSGSGTCQTVAQCTNPPAAPANGQVAFSNGNNPNSVASFTCNIGGTPPANVMCGASGSDQPWPAAGAGSCQAPRCTNPPANPTNGHVSFSNGDNGGSVASFTCNGAGTPPASVTCGATTSNVAWPAAGAGTCQAVQVCTSYNTCGTKYFKPATGGSTANCPGSGCTDALCCTGCPVQFSDFVTKCFASDINGCSATCALSASALDSAINALTSMSAAQAAKCAMDWNAAFASTALQNRQSFCPGVSAAFAPSAVVAIGLSAIARFF